MQRRGKMTTKRIGDLFFFFFPPPPLLPRLLVELWNCRVAEFISFIVQSPRGNENFPGENDKPSSRPELSEARLKSSSTRWYPLTTLLWPFKDKQDEDCRNVALSCSWEANVSGFSSFVSSNCVRRNCVNLIYISVEINPNEMRSLSSRLWSTTKVLCITRFG